jgi:hypothetical protein
MAVSVETSKRWCIDYIDCIGCMWDYMTIEEVMRGLDDQCAGKSST